MDVESTKPKKRAKKYLNNEDMLIQLKLSKSRGRLTEEMGRMFMMLAKRYASIPRFSGYSYNEDMQSAALLTLCKVWRSFNEEKYKNPFAYFTQITHNAFHAFNNGERKERDVRDKLLVVNGRNPSYNYSERMSSPVGGVDDATGDSDYMEHHDADIKFDAQDFDEAEGVVIDEALVKEIQEAINSDEVIQLSEDQL